MFMKKKRMRGSVQKVIKPVNGVPEKAQIDIHEAEDLYREIRVLWAEIDLADGKTTSAASWLATARDKFA